MVAPYNAPGRRPGADHGRLRHRLHQLPHRRAGPPADLRRVQPDHDRLHARTGSGDERAGPGLRGVRPLVQRGPFPDHGQPFVLDGGHVLGLRGQPADGQLHAPQPRRDDLRPPGAARQDLEGLRARARPGLLHRDHPHGPAKRPVRHQLRALRRVRARRRRRARCPTSRSSSRTCWPATATTTRPSGGPCLPGVEVPIDPPSSILAGEAFLARIYDAVRSASSATWDRTSSTRLLFVGWDEPGGTYDHVPPGRSRRRSPARPPGQLGFRFDRSGYRVPAVIVSPWVEEGPVCTDEYRHTSMLATLREVWDLGPPFTARDAAAPQLPRRPRSGHPRAPSSWPDINPVPVPAYQAERVAACQALGTLGRHLCHGLYEHARHTRDSPGRPSRTPTSHRHWPSTSPSISAPGCSPARLDPWGRLGLGQGVFHVELPTRPEGRSP